MDAAPVCKLGGPTGVAAVAVACSTGLTTVTAVTVLMSPLDRVVVLICVEVKGVWEVEVVEGFGVVERVLWLLEVMVTRVDEGVSEGRDSVLALEEEADEEDMVVSDTVVESVLDSAVELGEGAGFVVEGWLSDEVVDSSVGVAAGVDSARADRVSVGVDSAVA